MPGMEGKTKYIFIINHSITMMVMMMRMKIMMTSTVIALMDYTLCTRTFIY